jgi:K+-transporting ATPase KdpF subunit
MNVNKFDVFTSFQPIKFCKAKIVDFFFINNHELNMKLHRSILFTSMFEDLILFLSQWRKHKFYFSLFLLLCLNAFIAPAVYAQAEGNLVKTQAYAIALLGLVTLALSVYLFVVIFQPERF